MGGGGLRQAVGEEGVGGPGRRKKHGHIAKTEDATSGDSTAAICVTAQPRKRVKHGSIKTRTTQKKAGSNGNQTTIGKWSRPPPPSRIPLTRAKREGMGKEGGLSGAVRLNSVKRTHSRVIELPNMETAETQKLHRHTTRSMEGEFRQSFYGMTRRVSQLFSASFKPLRVPACYYLSKERRKKYTHKKEKKKKKEKNSVW